MKKIKHINENEYIVIPNPLYDVVFKYLMEDNESAKIILSTLLNEKILKLKFEPLSHTEKIKSPTSEKELKLFHLDFTALIELKDGSQELVMIEIQKANQASDIFRFKRYISANFQRKQESEYVNPQTQAIEKVYKPIRLIPIFILNFRIENEINDLIIKTNRTKSGIFKNQNLQKTNEFIDNLSYDIYVVQLPNLHNISKEEYENDDYKSRLYALFNLFDQESKNPKNKNRLLLLRSIFPGFLERVITRLRSADSDNPDLEEQMNIEEEYLAELVKHVNETIYFKQQLEKTIQVLEEKDKALEEKDKALEESLKIVYDSARMLKQNGISIDEIQKITRLTIDEIIRL